MQKNLKKFKSTPKRFHPQGLTILYEDHDIVVIDKKSGLLTISSEKVREKTAYYLLNDYVRKGNQKSRNRVFIVHRLDKDTSGVIVFAKNEDSKRYLQTEWKEFTKKYYAIVHGILTEKEGIITSYLTENKMHKMYSVDDATKGKLAKTGYKVLKEFNAFSLLEIKLFSGRKNQIRVHLFEKGHAVAGDTMYGKKQKGIKRLTLHATSLSLLHPSTKEQMNFKAPVPAYFKTFFKDYF